jgi:putative tricarboxylic transport membrane protein
LRLAALVVLVIGVIALSQIFRIGQGAGYTVIGPRFFPYLVVGGLLLLGVLFLLRTTRFPDQELAAQAAGEDATTHWSTVGLILLALIAYVFLLAPLGYPVATALFFPVVASILGSGRRVRDLIIGILLGLVIYLVFTRALGVRLPAGVLAGLL